jgi:hypothetical protein
MISMALPELFRRTRKGGLLQDDSKTDATIDTKTARHPRTMRFSFRGDFLRPELSP